MLLRLEREDTSVAGGRLVTWGDLYAEGEHVACTLEDPVREVPGQHVALWKRHGETAIPSGTYRLGFEDSPRFGADTLTLYDVPGFSHVRIHGGTDVDDTEGCVLVGSRQDRLAGTLHGAKVPQQLGAVRIAPALDVLKARIRAALLRERVFLQVRNAPGWYIGHGLPVSKAIG